ncbi:MAG: hypothetical protein K2X81_04700 [Candidatus Obscuribacterales bacterium]|nr:hypothetical protein [Candidatus Obscuribacterales bacterium]
MDKITTTTVDNIANAKHGADKEAVCKLLDEAGQGMNQRKSVFQALADASRPLQDGQHRFLELTSGAQANKFELVSSDKEGARGHDVVKEQYNSKQQLVFSDCYAKK